MIRLRYHHLLCVLRFVGEGYSRDFCENIKRIKESISNSDYILIEECDDVCAACPNNINSVCQYEQKVKRYDAAVKEALHNNVLPNPKDICSDCEWYYICKNIL